MSLTREMIIVPCMDCMWALSIVRVLRSLGYSTGNHQKQESGEAKEGICWNTRLAEFHDVVLKESGTTSNDPRPISDAWWTMDRLNHHVRQLAQLLADEFGDSEKILISDPRISRLLPLWKAYLAGQGFRHRWILPLEHPSGMTQKHGAPRANGDGCETLLWIQNAMEAERHTRDMERTLIPRGASVKTEPAETLARFLGVPRESTVATLQNAAEIGHVGSAVNQHSAEHWSDLANRVWEKLLRMSENDAGSHASLDALWREFSSLQAVIPPGLSATEHNCTDHLSDPLHASLNGPNNVAQSEQEWGIAQLQQKLQEVDMDNAEAWRRNDMVENECYTLKLAILAERKKLDSMVDSFSWWVTTPVRELNRMQARLRRSLAKRLVKLRKFAGKLSGSAEIPAPTKDETPGATAASNRNSANRIPVFSKLGHPSKQHHAIASAASRSPASEFAIYFSSSGNYFFQEIALLLHAAFTEAGFRAVLRTDEFGHAADAAFHLIVAPHEFFSLGKGSECFDSSMSGRLFFLNTEQPQTQWFSLAKAMFPHARHIFDMDRQTADAIQSLGYSASHLPLGYVENFAPYSADADLLVGPETEALGSTVRRWRSIGRPLRERPIDLSFVGEATPRRSAFFARVASLLEKYECHLRLMPRDSGVYTARGAQIHRRTPTTVGLSQRSKIFLNVHRDEKHYFEWHRIVLMGIWQRALVITETAPESPPFAAGRDYIQATLDEMPELIEYHLHDPRGIEEAEAIRNSGYERLRSSCNLPSLLKEAWAPFLAEAR